MNTLKKIFLGVGFSLLGVGLIICLHSQSPTDNSVLTIVTYNIRHGVGMDNTWNMERIAQVLQHLQPDIVALQEVDVHTQRANFMDEATFLGKQTGLQAIFVPAMPYDGGYYGNAILSRFPIVQIDTIPLPGEPRVAALATIAIPRGTFEDTILFIATHLDTRELPRRESIPLLQHHVKRYTYPAILAGDLNTPISSPEFQKLMSTWFLPPAENGLLTFPANAPRKQIDFILLKPQTAWQVISVTVFPETTASDHLPLILKVQRIP